MWLDRMRRPARQVFTTKLLPLAQSQRKTTDDALFAERRGTALRFATTIAWARLLVY
jgi:hypothetical protein